VATDAVLTAYHAVKRTAAVQATDTVVILGLGGLGFNALQIVRALGARVLVMDKRAEVLVEAVKFGVPAQDVIPAGQDAVQFVKEHGIVVDVVIDFVGVNETFAASQELGKPRPQPAILSLSLSAEGRGGGFEICTDVGPVSS
jgi:propanol-preferring alcohol dehydrogenase